MVRNTAGVPKPTTGTCPPQTRHSPFKKATGIKDTKRYINTVTLSNDGLIVYREELPFNQVRERIVVPCRVLDGLLTALHIRFDHPPQNQLCLAFNRYFFGLDLDKALGEISTNCHHCNSLKSFPPLLQPQTSEPPPGLIGVSFCCRCHVTL